MSAFINAVMFVLVIVGNAVAQQATETSATACYGAGAIVITVILTLLIAGGLSVGGYYAWLKYWKPRKERHLILETDPERGVKDEFAFDNPGFKDAALTPTASTIEKNEKSKVDPAIKSRWCQWSPLGVLTLKNEKRRTVDDNEIKRNDVKIVALRSHDFTGLGFNICGNMKDGIFVKDILHRGPASESGKLQTGDRIRSLTINFEHMVFEDALTILSYASPYDVVIEVQGHKNNINSGPFAQPRHPLFKSASITDLLQIKSARKSLFSDDKNLQKSLTKSFVPSFERNKSKSPKPKNIDQQDKLIIQDDTKLQTAENTSTYQSKFGVKVLPILSNETKISEQSIDLESSGDNFHSAIVLSIDEVDETKSTPPLIKKREKLTIKPAEEDALFRRNNSGIKRDSNGIPQELPSHLLNAAVAARNNRKSQLEDPPDDTKPAKKPKGKAPSPPEESKPATTRYNSDSDLDELVNTIELNASDITVHQSSEEQNRKTASTGDLTKITNRTASGTLERAQSLDITDNQPINTLPIKKHKNVDEPTRNLNDDDDGAVFQRIRLKKATEWGNLEDAIGKFGREDCKLDVSDESFDGSCEDNEGSVNEQIEKVEKEASALKDDIIKIERAILETNVNKDRIVNDIWPVDDDVDRTFIKHRVEEIIQEAVEIALKIPENNAVLTQNDIKLTSLQNTSNDFLTNERHWCSIDYHLPITSTTNVSDDMKVSMSSLERTIDKTKDETNDEFKITFPADYSTLDTDDDLMSDDEIVDLSRINISNITIIDDKPTTYPTKTPDTFNVTKTPSDTFNVTKTPSDTFNVTKTSSDTFTVTKTPEDTFNITKTPSDTFNVTKTPDTFNVTKTPDTFSVTHLNHDEQLLRILSTPDLIQNITIREALNDVNNHVTFDSDKTPVSQNHVTFDSGQVTFDAVRQNHVTFDSGQVTFDAVSQNHVTIEGPSSLSVDVSRQSGDEGLLGLKKLNGDDYTADAESSSSLTYITEIQVTPMLKRNVSEIEIIRDKNLDSEFENYVKNFDVKSSSLDHLDLQPDSLSLLNNNNSEVTVSLDANLDVQKEINKIQEIADGQLKKLPEMRFSSSSYESQYNRDMPKRHSQIDILRSNFERVNNTPTRHPKDPSPPKSRIPVALATTKSPPTSPERRDSRTDLEQPNKEIMDIMNSSNYKYNGGKTLGNNRNITVTSIRSNSKIPSGLNSHLGGGGGATSVRPPIAPRKSLDNGQLVDVHGHLGNVTIVTNGGSRAVDTGSASFKQWVFNPHDANGNNNSGVTNITVTPAKYDK